MNLTGKTVFFLGSSVTYGSAAGGVSFADIMAEQLGFTCIKEAVSGTTLADLDDSSYVARLKRVDPGLRPDLFICQLSTNDAGRNIPLAEVGTAIRWILRYARSTFGCPILFYTGTFFDSQPYRDMIHLLYRIREEIPFSILDLYHDEEMLSVSKENYQRYMRDPVHPTLAGYREWWTPKFIAACEAIPEGMVIHSHKISAAGIPKKVIYHFSDVHLAVQDDLSTPEENQRAMAASAGWANGRLDFAEKYGEPASRAQQKSSEAHFIDLLKLFEDGDAVVMAGDLCEYVSPANLRFLDSRLGSLDIPWLAVCGNHDKAEDIPEGYGFSRVKEPVQILDLGDLVLFGIDNSLRTVTARQNALLRQTLAMGKPLIIVMHIPIMTEGNKALLTDCGEYFRLNHPDADRETLEFIHILERNTDRILAVLAGHLHFGNISEIAPGLTQYVSSQGLLGNVIRYEIGE